MSVSRWILFVCGIATLNFRNADRPNRPVRPVSDTEQQIKYAEPDCPFFGPDRERFFTDALRRSVRHGARRGG